VLIVIIVVAAMVVMIRKSVVAAVAPADRDKTSKAGKQCDRANQQ